MKTLRKRGLQILSRTFLILVFSFISLLTICQNVNIPDINFKNQLLQNLSINTNGDNEIQVSEATPFSGEIVVNGQSVSNLTGIEAFINLDKLSCYYTSITTLNLSSNTELTWLICNSNQLNSLDVSTNTSLTLLHCGANQITSLDLSANSLLTDLDCSYNSLTLSSLNVKNGNNISMGSFRAHHNQLLTCITVDDSDLASSRWTVNEGDIDLIAHFSEDCSLGIDNYLNGFAIEVYPNPTLSTLTIQNASGLYHLSDITGKTLLSGTISAATFTLDISALSSGVYFLTLSEGEQQVVRKVIKQ